MEDAGSPEEARGPHLPDALRRLPWLAWLFVVLAVAYLYWSIRDSTFGANPSIGDVLGYALLVTPGLVAILLPAALLMRHPDARRRLPAILFGAILFAAVQGLLLLSDPLQPLFESLTPAGDDLPSLVPMAAAFDAFVLLVSVLGLAYIAVGLSQARRYRDRPAAAVVLFVPVAAILATILGVLSASRDDFGGAPMSPRLAIFLAGTVVLGILRVAVWAYLAAVATRGRLAGEEPTLGWWLVVLASALVLIALGLVSLGRVIDTGDTTFVTVYGYAIATAYVVGYVCLLVAFAVGLPELDEDEAGE